MNNPMSPPAQGGVSGTVLVLGVTVMFVTTTAAATLLAIFTEDATTVIAVLFANLAASVPAVLALAKVSNTAVQVEKLSNGLMDAKIRNGLATVLPDRMVDPDALPVLAADRQRLAVERALERQQRRQQQ